MKLDIRNILNPKKNYKLVENIKYGKKEAFIKELAEDYDSYGNIKYEVGKELEEVYKDIDNYEVGLHFTGYSNADQNFIDTVFNEGLINNQDAMQGVQTTYTNIEKTVSFVGNFTVFIGQLKGAYSYKTSQGAFLVKIPKEFLSEATSEDKKQPIYRQDEMGIRRLLPEFIHSYIPVSEEGEINNIIRNPNYKDKHHNKASNELIVEGQQVARRR